MITEDTKVEWIESLLNPISLKFILKHLTRNARVVPVESDEEVEQIAWLVGLEHYKDLHRLQVERGITICLYRWKDLCLGEIRRMSSESKYLWNNKDFKPPVSIDDWLRGH